MYALAMTKLNPYDWQIEDQRILRANGYTGLVAIEAGGGKSLTATLSIRDARPDVTLIVAPQSTHHTAWIPTLLDNAGVEARIISNGKKAEREAMFDFELGLPGAYIVTPQLITRMDVSSWRGDFLVWDEIHMGAVTPKSKSQRKVSGYSYQDGQPLNVRFDARQALTATPARGDFSNMWGVTRFLHPELNKRGQIAYDNFVSWQYERMEYEEIVTGVEWFETDWATYQTNPQGLWKKVVDGVPCLGNPKKARKFLTEREPGRLISEMPAVILHKRREGCCPWHPQGFLPTEEPQVIEREVILTSRQKKSIREMDAMMMTYIEMDPLTADISLTQRQRIRQLAMAEATVQDYIGKTSDGEEVEKNRVVFAPDAKSPIIDEIQHILTNLPEHEAVLVFSDSQIFAELITNQLNAAGHKAAEYSGVRKADLTKFGTDYRVLVGVTSAIGTGTAGLNAKSATEIYADQPISLTMQTQSNARLDRLDNTRRVQRFVILDDEGIAQGRMESLWGQKISIEKSLRRTV